MKLLFLYVVNFLFVSVSVAAPMTGVVMISKGQVKLKSGSTTTDAKVGAKIQEGDIITTGPDSRAKIVMSDRNVISVSPDTELQIEVYQNDAASGAKNVQMNLLNGKVRNNVEQTYDGTKSKFLIKTPTAVAGVRGTQFLTGFDKVSGLTSIVTFKGAVAVAAISATGQMLGAPVEVKKGQMSSVKSEAPPEPPKDVPKQDIKKMDVDSTAAMKSPSTETKSDVATANQSAPSGERSVASEKGPQANTPPPPVSMVTMADMDLGMAKQIKEVREALMPTAPATTIKSPTLDTSVVQDVVRDTVSKTKVIVQPKIQ